MVVTDISLVVIGQAYIFQNTSFAVLCSMAMVSYYNDKIESNISQVIDTYKQELFDIC